MSFGLFSTYRQGENRVTASILAVLGSLTLDRMQRLLRGLIGDQSIDLLVMRNQVAGNGKSVPDAEVSANFKFLIETKTVRNGLGERQLRHHLEKLGDGPGLRRLLVLTPDEEMPEVCQAITRDDPRIVWASFAALNQAVNDLIDDSGEVVSEREAFLLREMQAFLEAEGLLASPEDTVIVAARWAWPLYREFGVYVCQPERTFRGAMYLGFYADQAIQPSIPRIIKQFPNVSFGKAIDDPGEDPWLRDICSTLVERSYFTRESLNAVFNLTAPDDLNTLKLPKPVPNDWTDRHGRRVAYTMGHRYVRSSALRIARTTTDLSRESSESKV